MNRLNVISCYLSVLTCLTGGTVGSADESASNGSPVIRMSRAVLVDLQADDQEAALEKLARVADLLPPDKSTPGGSSTFRQPTEVQAAVGQAAAAIHRTLAQLSADERYDVWLKWTLGAEESVEARSLFVLTPHIAPPQEFARALGQRPRADSFAVPSIEQLTGCFDSMYELVEAAASSGQLNRLITTLERRQDRGARLNQVMLLAKLKRNAGDDENLLQAELQKRLEADATIPESSCTLAAVAVESTGTARLAEALAEQTLKINVGQNTQALNERVEAFLRRWHAYVVLRHRSPDTSVADFFQRPPQGWVSASAAGGHNSTGDISISQPVSWVDYERHIKRISGGNDDLLVLNFPLTGKFRLQGEVALLEDGIGGLTFGARGFHATSKTFFVRELQRSHQISRDWPFVADPKYRLFNFISIESDGDTVQFRSNTHPGWSASADSVAAFPWLGLWSTGPGRVVFRNLRLEDRPDETSEIRLLSPALPGWSDPLNPLPPSLQPWSTPAETDQHPIAEHSTAEVSSQRWQYQDEQLTAAPLDAANDSTRILPLLQYLRPLQTGEELRYEFYAANVQVAAFPALGSLAFLLEPQGVRLRWLNTHDDWTGLPVDNAILEPLNRRGPPDLPLQLEQWNAVSLKIGESGLQLSLNDQLIYERSVNDLPSLKFGFLHAPAESPLKIRNVVLKGNWSADQTPINGVERVHHRNDQTGAAED